MLFGPHSICYPLTFSLRITPPGRDVASRTIESMPSLFSVHAQDKPLIPAPIIITSAIRRSERAFHDLRERANECRVAIQRRNTPEVHHTGVSSDLLEENVEFITGLDVFGNEADWNNENIPDPLFTKLRYQITRERLEPFNRTNLALER